MTWEYIAGFFDGEGCISAKGVGSSTHRQLNITITQKDPHVLHEVVKFLGFGRVGIDKKSWGECGTLRISGARNQRKFLEGVYPHLIVRREQARLAFEFVDLIGVRGRRVLKETHDRREELSLLIASANKRGMI